MAHRSWYQGGGIGLVDDKGRVTIPADLRQALAANSPKADGKAGGTIIIGPHEASKKGLTAYDPAYRDVIAAKAAEREAANTAVTGRIDYNIKRRVSVGEEAPFDGSGRFIMPPFARFHAGIGEHAFFVGVFDSIEIWNPRTLLAATDYDADDVKALCRFHMQERGLAL